MKFIKSFALSTRKQVHDKNEMHHNKRLFFYQKQPPFIGKTLEKNIHLFLVIKTYKTRLYIRLLYL